MVLYGVKASCEGLMVHTSALWIQPASETLNSSSLKKTCLKHMLLTVIEFDLNPYIGQKLFAFC